jgi:hypothetical protein
MELTANQRRLVRRYVRKNAVLLQVVANNAEFGAAQELAAKLLVLVEGGRRPLPLPELIIANDPAPANSGMTKIEWIKYEDIPSRTINSSLVIVRISNLTTVIAKNFRNRKWMRVTFSHGDVVTRISDI